MTSIDLEDFDFDGCYEEIALLRDQDDNSISIGIIRVILKYLDIPLGEGIMTQRKVMAEITDKVVEVKKILVRMSRT